MKDQDFFEIVIEGYMFAVLSYDDTAGLCRCKLCGAVIGSPIAQHVDWHKELQNNITKKEYLM